LINSQSTFNNSIGEKVSIYNQRHLRSTIKYNFVLNETKGVIVYPMVMLRAANGSPLQYDISAVLESKKAGWIGVTYHNSYAVAVSAGIRHKNFTFGYAHDFILSQVNAYSKFSSEFILGYKFGENLAKQKQWNDEMNIRVDDLVESKKEQEEIILSLEEKQDSISNELAIVKEENNRILRENERISIEIDSVRENLKNQTVQMPVVTSNPKKSDEGYKSGESLKYLDENNQAPAAGYYLIIGSFGVEKNALNFKNKVIMNGMSNTALLLNTSKNVRNAYVFYSTNKSEVDAEKQKYIGKFNKIWILKLN
jgi:regulator of replication initiation timing